MIFPKHIKKGDRVGIVCLSSGVLGEQFVQHEAKLIEERLPKEFGLKFKYMDNALKGEEYLSKHPEQRAADLRQAFLDPEVDVIWSALGGDDTFRTIPYLMNDEFRKIVREHPKPFLGFSDTTNNHLMLYQLGLATFYAPALLSDVAELGPEIFPFTKEWLNELFVARKNIAVNSSLTWYSARTSFGADQLGVAQPENQEQHEHEYLFGSGVVEGELLGGCLDSLYEMLAGGRYPEQPKVFQEYAVFPTEEQWRDKIIFLETSEERPEPKLLQKMLEALAERGVFDVASGLIVGKPQDEVYYDEYKAIYQKLAKQYKLPTVFNLNFGHTAPRMVLPYGRPMRIDFDKQEISLPEGVMG